MKKLLIGLIAISLLTGCATKPPEKVKSASQENVTNDKNNVDQYVKVSIESANTLTNGASELKTLLAVTDVENEEWQSAVEHSVNNISKAVNDYMMVEINLSDDQEEKFKNTKSYYSQGVMSFGDIITDSRDALKTYDKKSFEQIKNRLDPASMLILKAKEQLEIDRYKE